MTIAANANPMVLGLVGRATLHGEVERPARQVQPSSPTSATNARRTPARSPPRKRPGVVDVDRTDQENQRRFAGAVHRIRRDVVWGASLRFAGAAGGTFRWVAAAGSPAVTVVGRLRADASRAGSVRRSQAARWYSWIRPPSTSTRSTGDSPVAGPTSLSLESGRGG
jgi:hypothetical protein